MHLKYLDVKNKNVAYQFLTFNILYARLLKLLYIAYIY